MLRLDAHGPFDCYSRASRVFQGSMRNFYAIVALVLTMWLTAAPVDAACFGNSEQSTAISAGQSDQALAEIAAGGHCQHVPCTSKEHSHSSGGCGGHNFVSSFASMQMKYLDSTTKVGFTNESGSGLDPLPPVPPPLA